MSCSQFYVRKDVMLEKLLPMYEVFIHDDTWHIRRACCTVLPAIIAALPAEMKASKAEEIFDTFSDDLSKSVRNSIMEVLGEVIA
ncbi:hypothetical protein BGW38_010341, partial [Lunasporangiospora selenospora]